MRISLTGNSNVFSKNIAFDFRVNVHKGKCKKNESKCHKIVRLSQEEMLGFVLCKSGYLRPLL